MLLIRSALAACALTLAATAIPAQDFPSRTLRIVVPYAAGGPSDTGTRLAAEPLARELGKPVVVENRGGGGGLDATEAYFKAESDGYTILVGSIGPLTIIPAFKPVSYDVEKDVVPLSTVWRSAQVLAVRPSLGVKSVAEFVAYAKANPSKLTIGSAGVGAVTHLAIEVLKREAKIELIHVPFRSTSESLPQLIGGQIDALFGDGPIIAPQVNGGGIVALAVAGPARGRALAGGADHGRSRISQRGSGKLVRAGGLLQRRRHRSSSGCKARGHGPEGSDLPGEARQARRERRRAGPGSLRQADQEGCSEVGRYHQGGRDQARVAAITNAKVIRP